MRAQTRKIRIGIIGCGAIGSRMAKSIQDDMAKQCRLSGLYDLAAEKAEKLGRQLRKKKLFKTSLEGLFRNCDLVVEAVNAPDTKSIIAKALKKRKDVLVMSVGKILNDQNLFSLAHKNRCSLLIPSGAIAGMDAIKAASPLKFSSLTLTTRKPLSGFKNNPYLRQKRLDVDQITAETVIFDGDVNSAVKFFPQNINVAATLALASQAKNKLRIRILTSPEFKTNSHEIEAVGDFGRILTRTENVVCPDNPKTSYLAVLSAIQTLKQYVNNNHIGT
jgi:aspartate dehydrogenase